MADWDIVVVAFSDRGKAFINEVVKLPSSKADSNFEEGIIEEVPLKLGVRRKTLRARVILTPVKMALMVEEQGKKHGLIVGEDFYVEVLHE